ncbi:MAG TPA: hypothetical protein ENK23_09090 [Sorangium sp.]|nr:hypothetical protein [Sorangium sp.]
MTRKDRDPQPSHQLRLTREAAQRRRAQLWTTLGIAAAVVITLLCNVLVARHYRRWDWTEVGQYTLSPVTKRTLSALRGPLQVYVLLPSNDPMTLTMRHTLAAYGAETSKLQTRFVDPDRNKAELLALQKRYGISAGKTEEGRTVTDAAIIVARGEKRHLITGSDLFVVEQGEELRARTRVEEVLTGAIRRIERGDTPKVCFTTGHGEVSLDSAGPEGLQALARRLDKLNYEAVALPPARDLGGADMLKQCKVLVVAAPSRPVPPEDVRRYRRYVERGGNALVFMGPVPDEGRPGYLPLGLQPLLALAGVQINADFVFERDPSLRSAQGHGETFSAIPQPHPITEGFMEAPDAFHVVLTVSSSLKILADAANAPRPLLVSSPRAFGMRDFFRWAQNPVEPEPQKDDDLGPLTLAVAVELPKLDAQAEQGPRMVVFASTSGIYGANWQHPDLRGTALLVESCISWLNAEAFEADIAAKPARSAGAAITEQRLSAVFVRVVVLLPLASLLLGLAVYFRRRRERRGSATTRGHTT